MGIGRRRVRCLRDERGASLIETALVLIFVLFPLLVGVADVGRAFWAYISITNAAREGARYGSRFPWLPDRIRNAAIAEAAGGGVVLQPADITINPEAPPGSDPTDPGVPQPGQHIWVGVTFRFQPIIGAPFGVGALTLRAGTRMVVFGSDV